MGPRVGTVLLVACLAASGGAIGCVDENAARGRLAVRVEADAGTDGGSDSEQVEAEGAAFSCSPACRPGTTPCLDACGNPGVRTCNLRTGCLSRCHATGHFTTPTSEVCDFEDNDCDGAVDEGPLICDDGLKCTVDTCLGPLGCLNDAQQELCDDGIECTVDSCGGPGSGVSGTTTGPDTNDCFHTTSDAYCTDEWDGCDCNGRERCNPPASPDASGCVGTPRVEFPFGPGVARIIHAPCERRQAGGDNNACTIELCCDNNAGGTRWLGQGCPETLTDEELAACQAVSEEVTSETGGTVWCPGRRAPEPFDNACFDANPCTVDSCRSPVGTCIYSAVSAGTTASDCTDAWDVDACNCGDRFENGGCAHEECDGGGSCTLVPIDPDEEPPPDTICGSGHIADTCQGFRCNPGTAICEIFDDHAACDDGRFCTLEVCGPPLDPNADPVPGRPRGCRYTGTSPCGDSWTCTIAACNEADDECLVIPSHETCSTGDPCDSPVCNPQPGTPPGTGCVPGDHPCDDAIDCTVDFCTEDEFGQRRCAHDTRPCETR